MSQTSNLMLRGFHKAIRKQMSNLNLIIMNKLKISSIFMMLLMLLGSVASCITNEGNYTDIPQELLKTWNMPDGSSITFRSDGTGIYTTETEDQIRPRATVRIAFSYFYQEENNRRKLTIKMENDPEPEVFYILKLTSSRLEVMDDDGEYINMVSEYFDGNGDSDEDKDEDKDDMNEGDSVPSQQPNLELSKTNIAGKWGFCNKTVWEVRDTTLYWTTGDSTIAYPIHLGYRTITIFDGAVSAFTVHRLTSEYIVLSDEDSPYEKFFFFKMEDDGNIIGDISLLYDKRWQTAPGVENVSLIFSKDGTASFKSDTDGAFSCSYTYDRANKVIHMKSPYGDADMVLVKLTQNTLIVNVISEEDGVRDEEMLEFRILD